jgi:hypothetical protein
MATLMVAGRPHETGVWFDGRHGFDTCVDSAIDLAEILGRKTDGEIRAMRKHYANRYELWTVGHWEAWSEEADAVIDWLTSVTIGGCWLWDEGDIRLLSDEEAREWMD